MKATVYQINEKKVKKYVDMVQSIISEECNSKNYFDCQSAFYDIKDEIFKCVFGRIYRDIIWLHRFISEYFELLKHDHLYDSVIKNRVKEEFKKLEEKLYKNIRNEDVVSDIATIAAKYGKEIEKSNMSYDQIKKFLQDIKEF